MKLSINETNVTRIFTLIVMGVVFVVAGFFTTEVEAQVDYAHNSDHNDSLVKTVYEIDKLQRHLISRHDSGGYNLHNNHVHDGMSAGQITYQYNELLHEHRRAHRDGSLDHDGVQSSYHDFSSGGFVSRTRGGGSIGDGGNVIVLATHHNGGIPISQIRDGGSIGDGGNVIVLDTHYDGGIPLSQVPYTGFEAGPTLTNLFYALLTLWGLVVSYVFMTKKNRLFSYRSGKDASKDIDLSHQGFDLDEDTVVEDNKELYNHTPDRLVPVVSSGAKFFNKTNLAPVSVWAVGLIFSIFLIPQMVLADCGNAVAPECGDDAHTCVGDGYVDNISDTDDQYIWECISYQCPSVLRNHCIISKSISPSCSATTLEWTYGGDSCSFVLPQTDAGSSVTVDDTTWRDTGSATFACNASGNWTTPTNYSCYNGCGGGTQSWEVGNNTCYGSVSNTIHDSSDSTDDTTGSDTGSATFQCNDGAWVEQSGSTCTKEAEVTCRGNVLGTWTYGGDSCSVGLPETDAGSSVTVTDSSYRDTGTATFTCNNDGTWINSVTNHSCYDGCSGGTQSWEVGNNTCYGSVSNTIHDSSDSTDDTTGSDTGSATFQCNDGAWVEQSGSTCTKEAEVTCRGNVLGTWTYGGDSCSVGLPETDAGSSVTVTDSSYRDTGTATFTCNNDGTWINSVTNHSCYDGCSGGTQSWEVGNNTCYGSVSNTIHDSSDSTDDTTGSDTGSATFQCNDGAWVEQSGSTCTKEAEVTCRGNVLGTWTYGGDSCSVGLPETDAGSSVTVTDSSYRDTGTATFTCNNDGTWINSVTNHSCYNGCGGGTQSWEVGNNTCYGSVSNTIHDSSDSTDDTTGSDTGSATFQCNDGAWVEQSGSTCTKEAEVTCRGNVLGTWTYGGDSCSVGLPETDAGSSVTVTDSSYRDTGTATFTCNNDGTWINSVTNHSCYNGCGGGTQSWEVGNNTCYGSVSNTIHDSSDSTDDTTGSDTGSATFQCNDGAWVEQSGSTCTKEAEVTCRGNVLGTWTYGGDSCSVGLPETDAGSSVTVTDSSYRDTGTATFTCNNDGTWINSVTNHSCYDGCSGSTQSWEVGNNTCYGSVSNTIHDSSDSTDDTTGSDTGSATFQCNDGAWVEQSGATCDTAPPTSCSATTLDWIYGGDSCSASVPQTTSGGSRTANDTTWRDTGSATFTCTNGTWSNPTSQSCYNGCGSSNQSWEVGNNTCYGSVSNTIHDSSDSTDDTTGSDTGSATFQCNDGAWVEQSGATCTTLINTTSNDPSCNLSVNPATVQRGQQTTLTWNTSYANTVTINQGIGPVPLDGNRNVTINNSKTFTLAASNSGGDSTQCTTQVYVVQDSPLTCDLDVDDSRVTRGDEVTLSWYTDNADTVTINHGIGSVSLDGNQKVIINDDATFTLTATDINGQTVSCTQSVDVESGGGGGSSSKRPRCYELDASETTVYPGDRVRLSWETNNAREIELYADSDFNSGRLVYDTG